MVKKLYLGVDIGTYETKGVLVDKKGNIYNQAFVKHEMIVPKPGWAEHSSKDVWWGDFVKITKQLLKGVAAGSGLGLGVMYLGNEGEGESFTS